MFAFLNILGFLGLLTSLYSLYAYFRSVRDKDYHALCDINDRISCSKTFRGKYGKFLGLPNGLWGIIFYSAILYSVNMLSVGWVLLLSAWGAIFSVRLAYILSTRVKVYCIDCITIYIVNGLLLIAAFLEYFQFANPLS